MRFWVVSVDDNKINHFMYLPTVSLDVLVNEIITGYIGKKSIV